MATGKKIQTNNYAMFVSSDDNRDAKVRRDLVEKMKAEGFPSCHAILVRRSRSGKFEILRGQHRFLAAQHLGIKFWYEITDDEFDTIQDAGDTKPWRLQDYVTVYARHGLDDYIELKSFCDRHKLSYSTGATLFRATVRGGSQSKNIRSGQFKIADRQLANKTVVLLAAITKVCPRVGQSRLVDALLGVVLIEGFSLNTWLKRIQQNYKRIKKCETQDGYLKMLEDVYNFRMPLDQQKNIAFLAKQSLKRAK